MQLPMHRALRCRARTRRGTECQSPAMPNGRCRMHGGTNPGAPKGNRNAWKHGGRSAEAMQAASVAAQHAVAAIDQGSVGG